MNNVLVEPINLGDLIKFEEDEVLYSRDTVQVAPGQNLHLGEVVGALTASGQIKTLDTTASDGSEVAVGVLLSDVTTTSSQAPAVVLARHAIVADNAIVWSAGISTVNKARAIRQLKALGIVIRQGA